MYTKSYLLKGNSNKAVLILHGWSATPQQTLHLGKELNNHGYNVRAPLLSGHGTNPKDLIGVNWKEWLDQTEKELIALKKDYKEVSIIGFSLGASLAILLANKHIVYKTVVISLPLVFRYHHFSKTLASLLSIKNINLKKKYNHYSEIEKKWIYKYEEAYREMPTKSVNEPFRIAKYAGEALKNKVNSKLLVIASNNDPILSKKNSYQFISKIQSKEKKLTMFNSKLHLPTSDYFFRKEVSSEICNYLNA